MAAANIQISGLENLHEIILPEPASWIPQTVGWYVIFGLILVLAAWWIYRAFQHLRKNRYRKLALNELAVIEQELLHPEKRSRALSEIPILVKTVALSAFPRADVAGLSSDSWLAFLDKTIGGKDFTEGEGRLLPELAYAPVQRIALISEEQICKLLQVIRRWIKRHGTSVEE